MTQVVAAVGHPDDECLGVGGTLARHAAAGDTVTVVVATHARRGHVTADLVRESVKALGNVAFRLLNLDYMTLDRDPLGLNHALEPILAALAPEVIYTHFPGDLNSDHRAVAQAVLVASRPIGGAFPRRVLAFETPSSTEWGLDDTFRPNVFVDVAATLDAKLRAVACYAEELREAPHPRSESSLRARAAYWGQVSGLAVAEPFVLLREVIR